MSNKYSWEDWIKGGLAGVLDLPTEGVAPSVINGSNPQGQYTETVGPNNQVANQVPESGIAGIRPIYIIGAIGLLIAAKSFKLI